MVQRRLHSLKLKLLAITLITCLFRGTHSFCLLQHSRPSCSFGGVIVPSQRSAKSTSLKSSNADRKIMFRKKIIEKRLSCDNDVIADVPTTMREAIIKFFFDKGNIGPPLTILAISAIICCRISMPQSFSWADIVCILASALLWLFQEHFLHQHLLHSKIDWIGKSIHESHHQKPYFHISIDPPELLLGWLGAFFIIANEVMPIELALSTTIGYSIAGMFYEWCHFIVHTRVKHKNVYFRQVRDNHIKHHLRDSKNWFGFSVPYIDDMFGTNPK
mmetsp:Transcript_8044/g.10304  ORF Transcript_8044/g.10304 Transcript_8044/m.10304 type:complete len:274 (-) Transcript_8044:265-1086(-)